MYLILSFNYRFIVLFYDCLVILYIYINCTFIIKLKIGYRPDRIFNHRPVLVARIMPAP